MFKKIFKESNVLKFEARSLTRKDAELFYTLKRYYNPISPNIAVFGDKEKFENLIKEYSAEYNTNRGSRVIRVNERKIIFITGDLELTIVLIEKMLDLLEYNLTYRKFL